MADDNPGTHRSGPIGAGGHDGVGVAGVNRDGKLMRIKCLAYNGAGYTSGAVDGVLYAVD